MARSRKIAGSVAALPSPRRLTRMPNTHRRSPCGGVGERPVALDQEEAAGQPGRATTKACLAEQQVVGAGVDSDQVVAQDAGDVVGAVADVAVVERHCAVLAAVWCVRVGRLDSDEGIPFRPPGAGPREPFALQPVMGGRGVGADRLPAAVEVERVGDRTRPR
jgi:hypothetical protein